MLLHSGTELKVIVRTCALFSTLPTQLNRPLISAGFEDTRGKTPARMIRRLETESPAVTELPLRISDHLHLCQSFYDNRGFVSVNQIGSEFRHINFYRGRADALCPGQTAKFHSRRIVRTGGPGSPGAPGCPSQPCCPRGPGSPGSPSGPLSPLCPGNKSQKDIQALIRSG